MFKYILYKLKNKLCLGVFRIKEEHGYDNETVLKKGGGIEIEIYIHIRDCTLSLFVFCIFTYIEMERFE